jgi:antitoxin component of MazEF toxin-antitoxin module
LGGPEKRQRVADVVNIVHNVSVAKRLQAIGNSAGIIIDKPILDLLGITAETELELKTDGERLIITPVRDRAQRIAKVQARVVRKHQRTFQKLAK